MNVKTNVGKEFLRLLRLHFHPNHRLHSIFNTKTVKVSYCCMRNVSSIISGHNRHILCKDPPEAEIKMCNCRHPGECPMNGKCLVRNVIYKGDVNNQTDNQSNAYVGLTSMAFKDRYVLHNQGIRHRNHANSCELTKHVWTLKDSNKEFSIGWNILEHVKGRFVGGECKLCITEKLHILEHQNQLGLLNSNSDMKCVHGWKFKLGQLGAQGRGRTRWREDRGTTAGVT